TLPRSPERPDTRALRSFPVHHRLRFDQHEGSDIRQLVQAFRAPLAATLLAATVTACNGRSAPEDATASDQISSASAASVPDSNRTASGLLLPGERHLRNARQLTFEGNNAEAYFSADGRQLIFQRQVDGKNACDQQFIINVDGSGLRQVSNGKGRTTCGFFYDDDRRILYSSTHEHSPDCPAPPDHSQGYVWPLGHFEIYSQRVDGSDRTRLTSNGAYNAEAT